MLRGRQNRQVVQRHTRILSTPQCSQKLHGSLHGLQAVQRVRLWKEQVLSRLQGRLQRPPGQIPYHQRKAGETKAQGRSCSIGRYLTSKQPRHGTKSKWNIKPFSSLISSLLPWSYWFDTTQWLWQVAQDADRVQRPRRHLQLHGLNHVERGVPLLPARPEEVGHRRRVHRIHRLLVHLRVSSRLHTILPLPHVQMVRAGES